MYLELKKEKFIFHQFMNILQSVLLLGGMISILGLTGWMIAGLEGLLWSFILGAATLILSPYVSPQWMMKLHQAKALSPEEAPGLYHVISRLAAKAELPVVPRLYYVPSATVNAFTVGGKKDSAIALTDGVLRQLNEREIIGVLAHEMAHIQNNDTWILSLATHTNRLTRMMAYLGGFLLLFNLPFLLIAGYGVPWLLIAALIGIPWLSFLLQQALSRTREFKADLGAAYFTQDPWGLASALEKINRGLKMRQWWLPQGYRANSNMLQTHPPTKERIDRLLSLGDANPAIPYFENSGSPRGYRLL